MRMRSILVAFVFTLVVSEIQCAETSITVCEGEKHEITCDGNQKIRIIAADFGRSEREVCKKNFLENDLNTNCHSPKALEITQNECDGFTSCTLYARTQEYGDPCWFVKKYLTVSYKCEKGNGLEKTRICEGKQESIICPKGSEIDVEYANYGRLKGNHVCGFFALTADCKSEAKSLEIVKRDCQGERSCVLEANNGKFGDPCFLTQKYLEVHYRCKGENGGQGGGQVVINVS